MDSARRLPRTCACNIDSPVGDSRHVPSPVIGPPNHVAEALDTVIDWSVNAMRVLRSCNGGKEGKGLSPTLDRLTSPRTPTGSTALAASGTASSRRSVASPSPCQSRIYPWVLAASGLLFN